MSDTSELTSYGEILRVLDLLPDLVREKRRRDGLSLRGAEAASGVGMTTIMRFENGHDPSWSTGIALLRWVGAAPTEAEQ